MNIVAKAIATANKKFKAMDLPQKRVTIAQDVIDSLRKKKMTASSGQFLDFSRSLTDESLEIMLSNGLVGQVLEKSCEQKIGCDVCALGGLFVGMTHHMPIKSSGVLNPLGVNTDDMFDQIRKVFSERQMHMIEMAFECGSGYFSDENLLSDKERDSCVAFGMRFSDDRQRMIAIMENIISNDGCFFPDKRVKHGA